MVKPMTILLEDEEIIRETGATKPYSNIAFMRYRGLNKAQAKKILEKLNPYSTCTSNRGILTCISYEALQALKKEVEE